MAWVERNGHHYFYLSQRHGKRVRKIYVGQGDTAQVAELLLATRKEQRDAPREWLRKTAEIYTQLDVIDACMTLEMSAILFARARIHLDSRIARRTLLTIKGQKMAEQFAKEILPLEDENAWQQLSKRASRGDREAATALMPILDSNPQLVDRWSDLSRVALNRWLDILSGGNELTKKATHIRILELVRSVRQFDNDPLEKSMAQRIGILWLQVNYFDTQAALVTPRTPTEQTFFAKRQKDAQKLYTDAAMSLREYQSHLADSKSRLKAKY